MKNLLPGLFLLIPFITRPQSTIVKYLSGVDKDHTVAWDFYCTGGRNSGKWSRIAVPSNWELQGFGSYNYGHDKVKADETGIYRHQFPTEAGWRHKRIFLVFEGAMTDTKVTVNGISAGPVHQGGFYRFKYDITGALKASGINSMEVTVNKMSADASVNSAERNGDFWIFGGIFRPVYLEIVPTTFIDRVAVDARADGSIHLDVYPQNMPEGATVTAQVQQLNGQAMGKPLQGKPVAGEEKLSLTGHIANPLLWSAEFPHLYQVLVTIKNNKGIIHSIKQRFGFRTIELRTQDALYVNGARIMLKGCNRHSFWPETGRTLSHAVHLMDIKLMKDMNMNAVRMSHYPPDQDFLNLCDSMGLYVLDELTGWQAAYDTTVGRRLVKELVLRDVNHPSIIFWDNGNEGGWNRGLDGDYGLYDPQRRIVIHPWERFNGTNTKHYPDYDYIVKSVAEEKDVFFPTEFMHGLYDGGAGAALEDFWSMMLRHPHGAGGFIWAFLDEAVIRTDKQGMYDADGNHAPDGIVGPHREKEASYYTIKEVWSPVYIDTLAGALQQLAIENRYSFTNLRQCTFKWKLCRFPSPKDKKLKPEVVAAGNIASPDLAPGKKGLLKLELPASWRQSDALFLTAFGPDKRELFTWSWGIPHTGEPPGIASKHTGTVRTAEDGDALIVSCDDIQFHFDKGTGYIEKLVKPSTVVSLSGGPSLAGVNTSLKSFTHAMVDGQCIVKAAYEGDACGLQVKWTFASGKPVRLDYTYVQQGDVDFMGISFRYPEKNITGMKWQGRGPYRVWQNRMKGQQLGVWYKKYNNTVTGENWGYPEFKGYHAEVAWVTIENKESPFTIYTSDNNTYLQMLHPQRESAALANNNVEPPFPAGDIGLLKAISPIGTKFQAAKVMGPQSQRTHVDGAPISGTLWFDLAN